MFRKIVPFVVAGVLLASNSIAHAQTAPSPVKNASAQTLAQAQSSKAALAKAMISADKKAAKSLGGALLSGFASVYGFETGSRTASGKKLQLTELTAAHRTLPFGTSVLVTNKRNGKTVTVVINDRGPFVKGRVIDVTPAAAKALGFSGLTQVSLSVVKNEPKKITEAAGI